MKKIGIDNIDIRIDRNRWMAASIIFAIILLFSLIFLWMQVIHNQHNTRLFIVKLSPDGSHTETFLKEQSMPTYFMNTVNSLLTQYVKRRYSKRRETIIADYGFAYHFLSPKLKKQFMNEYHAIKKAKDFKDCTTCPQKQVTVDAIQHNETNAEILDAKPLCTYRSTVFVTVTTRRLNGSLQDKSKQIITLVWKIRTFKEMNANIKALTADPIGIKILRESVKNTPKAA